MNRRAIIFGVKGHLLNKREKELIKKTKPWGIILFSRNVKNIEQLKKLIWQIKKIFNDKKYPILMDVEGGKVSRIDKIIDLKIFSQNFFEKLYIKNKKAFLIYYKTYIDSVSSILKHVGVNINTVPVLDIIRKKTHNVIGTRSFSSSLKNVYTLGNICIKNFENNKIGTVIKHIPGHGLSKHDTHYKTSIVQEGKKVLINKDFKAFKKCKSIFAMTAHVIYKKYDSRNTATHSKIVIKKIIRNYIKFNGILISDDISMKSLKFGLERNALKALDAGCNLILHCNGNIKEMNKLSKIIPKIDNFTKKKTSDFYKFLG